MRLGTLTDLMRLHAKIPDPPWVFFSRFSNFSDTLNTILKNKFEKNNVYMFWYACYIDIFYEIEKYYFSSTMTEIPAAVAVGDAVAGKTVYQTRSQKFDRDSHARKMPS